MDKLQIEERIKHLDGLIPHIGKGSFSPSVLYGTTEEEKIRFNKERAYLVGYLNALNKK